MIQEERSCYQEKTQIYGFICQKNNVFYSFDSPEIYQQLVEWLDKQEASKATANPRKEDRNQQTMTAEADQL